MKGGDGPPAPGTCRAGASPAGVVRLTATPGYRTLAGEWRGRTLNASEPPRQQNGRVHVQGHDQARAEPDAEPVRQGLRGKRLKEACTRATLSRAVPSSSLS